MHAMNMPNNTYLNSFMYELMMIPSLQGQCKTQKMCIIEFKNI